MTYYNGNPYREDITAWAHDTCLPDDQYETDRHGERVQVDPWHWSPRWGAPRPCTYCGTDVQ